MAANGARRALNFSSASAKSMLSGSSATRLASNLKGFASSKPASSSCRLSLRRFTTSKCPVELSGIQSLMPLHSATASALFSSLLSLSNERWGCLSEGFATPL